MSKGALTDGRVASLASRQETPLYRATAEAKIDAMKLLIERGANVNAARACVRTDRGRARRLQTAEEPCPPQKRPPREPAA